MMLLQGTALAWAVATPRPPRQRIPNTSAPVDAGDHTAGTSATEPPRVVAWPDGDPMEAVVLVDGRSEEWLAGSVFDDDGERRARRPLAVHRPRVRSLHAMRHLPVHLWRRARSGRPHRRWSADRPSLGEDGPEQVQPPVPDHRDQVVALDVEVDRSHAVQNAVDPPAVEVARGTAVVRPKTCRTSTAAFPRRIFLDLVVDGDDLEARDLGRASRGSGGRPVRRARLA